MKCLFCPCSAIYYFLYDKHHQNFLSDQLQPLFNREHYCQALGTLRKWENMSYLQKNKATTGENPVDLVPGGKGSLVASVLCIKVSKTPEFTGPELFSRNYHLAFSSALTHFSLTRIHGPMFKIFFKDFLKESNIYHKKLESIVKLR